MSGGGGGNDPFGGSPGETGAGANDPGKGGNSPTSGGGPTGIGTSPDPGSPIGGGEPSGGGSPLPYAPSDPFGGTPGGGGIPGLPDPLQPDPNASPLGGPTSSPLGPDPLGGPGPVGGTPGLPGGGGGTNTPWGNFPGLGGGEFNYIPGVSSPITSDGVSAVGGDTGASSTAFTGPTLDQLQGTAESSGVTAPMAPGGASAASTAAPSGVESVVDLSQAASPAARSSNSGGTSQTAAVQGGGLLESLGLGRAGGSGGLGAAGPLVAGAGLINNLINGRRDAPEVSVLRDLAAQAQQRQNEISAQAGPQRETGARVSGAGEQQIAAGQGITQQGRDIISSGQAQLPGGQALQQWIQTGTLPPAYESQVMAGVNAARQAAISQAAASGQPTDPTRNSTLAENIRQIEARAPEMRMALAQTLANTGTGIIGSANQTIGAGGGIVGQGNQTASTGGGLVTTGTSTANSLITSGIQNAGLSAQIYQNLLTNRNARDARTGQAIGNFASALNGTRRVA